MIMSVYLASVTYLRIALLGLEPTNGKSERAIQINGGTGQWMHQERYQIRAVPLDLE